MYVERKWFIVVTHQLAHRLANQPRPYTSFVPAGVLFGEDPVITISDDSSEVTFTGLGLSSVETGVCVIEVRFLYNLISLV